MYVALAEELGEMLLTSDQALARAARHHSGVDVALLAVR
jgi:predicted nucleic acid-binding protein